MQIEAIAFLSFSALLGLIYCIFGSRFFRILITFSAFVAGLLVTYHIAGVYFTTVIAKIAISVTGGLVFALVFSILHHIGRFIFGVLAAVSAGVLIINVFQLSKISYVWDVLLLLSLILGICSVNKQTVLRFATAFFGAFMLTVAGFYIIFIGIIPQDFTSIQGLQKIIKEVIITYPYYVPACVLFFTLVGMFFQFWQSLRFLPGHTPVKPPVSPKTLLLTAAKQDDAVNETVVESSGEVMGKDINLS